MVIVALAINSVAERQKNEVITAVNYQGEAAMEIIEQDIHEASSIASPSSGITANAIQLNMPQTSLIRLFSVHITMARQIIWKLARAVRQLIPI